MKNILLALLLANVLYFIWGLSGDDDPQPGVEVVEESDLGPPLDVTTHQDSESVASVGAVLGSGDQSALEAVVGRSCVSIGPFTDNEDADSAVLEYAGEGMQTALREAREEVFVGHWVQIRDVPDDAAAATMLATLRDGGLSDAYKNVTEDEGIKISLGLFGELERAQNVERQAQSLDLPAEISPRTRQGDVFYVDIGLPPGKGAEAIVERYGQDRVALRDAATCPK